MIRGIMARITARNYPARDSRVISLRDRSISEPAHQSARLHFRHSPRARDSIWTTSDPLHFPHLLPIVTDGPGWCARAAHTEVPHMVDAAAATAAAAAAAAKLAVISVRQQSWLTG